MSNTGQGAKADLITDHRYVTVNGKQAAWLFSEFETAKPLKGLVRWLTPKDWPSWGAPFFKKMERVGQEVHGPSGDEWQANYLEVVELEGQELRTVLRCDFQRADGWAAMTYDLDHSVDDKLQVDRGFLLAVETPDRKQRQVKALKVVGFTDPDQTLEAEEVGPVWTEWIKAAIEVATEEGSKGPSVGHHGTGGSAVTVDSVADYYKDRANQWTDCVTGMAQFYSGYATDLGSRLYSGAYKPTDAAGDSARLFLRLARDWSRLWRAGAEMAETFADADVPATTAGDPVVDYSDVLVSAAKRPAQVKVCDLVKVGLEDTRLDPAHIEVDPKSVPKDPDPAVIRLKPHPRAGPSGLYAGHLEVEDKKHPAFVYISKARPVA
jgi:hypothetical protein